jgi:hypothetical protein
LIAISLSAENTTTSSVIRHGHYECPARSHLLLQQHFC